MTSRMGGEPGPWRAALALLGVLALGCSGGEGPADVRGPGDDDEEPPAGSVFVSQPVDRALLEGGGTGRVIFVSAPPGAYPRGVRAWLRNVANGHRDSVRLVEGGFDPLALPGGEDDRVEIVVEDSAGLAIPAGTVSARGRPRVLRVSGTARRTDTPLNFRVSAVFTTPVQQLSAEQGVRLFRDGYPIAARFERVPGTATEVALVALEYDAEAAYELRITTEVRDVNGEPLEAGVSRWYQAPEVSPGDSVSVTSFEVVPQHEPELVDHPTALHYRNRQVEVGDALLLRGIVRGEMPGTRFPTPVRVLAPVRWQVLTPGTATLSADTGLAVRLVGRAQGPARVVATTVLGLSDTVAVWVTRLPERDVAGLRVLMRWDEWDMNIVEPMNGWWPLGLVAVSPAGGPPRQLSASGYQVLDGDSPSLRPDGVLAYVAGSTSILFRTLERQVTALGWLTFETTCPRWSPDGSRLAFTARDAQGYGIGLRDADGSLRMALRTLGPACPSWSRDGRRVAYVDVPLGMLMVADLLGVEATRALPLPGTPLSPAVWPLNGHMGPSLVVRLADDGGAALVVAHEDGSGYSVHADRPEFPTSWTPDGEFELVNAPGWGGPAEWVMLRRHRDGAMRAVLPGRDGIFVPVDYDVLR